MTNFDRKRVRLGGLLALALGAVALLAIAGLAAAHGRHGDRHRNGQDTGQVAAFDASTGVLAIKLSGGDTVTGLVSRRTKIKCEDEHSPDIASRSRGSEPGDDHGGHGTEPGDDNGGGNSGSGPSHSGPSGHDDNGTGANCTASDLIVGATVHEAELDLRNGKAVWDEVELNG
jgi:hypothetical protein